MSSVNRPESDGWTFDANGYSAWPKLTTDRCVALLESAARQRGGENLVAAIDFARDDSEIDDQQARRWIAAVHRARDGGAIAEDVAMLAVDAIFDVAFLQQTYEDDIASRLVGELNDLQARHEVIAGSDREALQPGEGWFDAHGRWMARLDELRDAMLDELGAEEMVRAMRAGQVAFAARLHAARVHLCRESGVPLAEHFRRSMVRRLTGHRILDEWMYLNVHQPTADECLFLIKAGARGLGDSTLGSTLDWAEARAGTSAQARRWMAGARWAREADAISRDVSWMFISSMYQIAYESEAFDDSVSRAIEAEQEAVLERHGIDEQRDADPTWYAPEEWWTLNRRWHTRLDQQQCAMLRSIGEDEMAAAIEAEGGQAFSDRMDEIREAVEADS